MKEIKNYAKDKLKNQQSAAGIWSIIPSCTAAEIMASAGLDFIIFDMEHGPFDIKDVYDSIRAISAYNCSPLVRIPKVDVTLIQKLLDSDAHGIIVPQIRSVSDALELVKSSNFPPAGIRGFNPFTRSGLFDGSSDNNFYNPDFPLIVGIIENLDAVNCLDELLDIDGIDVWYLGIYDMSCALGLNGQLTHPKVVELIEECERKIIEKGKISGRMVNSVSEADSSITEFLVLKPDTFQLKNAITEKLL